MERNNHVRFEIWPHAVIGNPHAVFEIQLRVKGGPFGRSKHYFDGLSAPPLKQPKDSAVCNRPIPDLVVLNDNAKYSC
jgi:hypothetical protein